MSLEPTNGTVEVAEHEREEIAIVGMAGRFPGAPDLERFWQNVRAGHEAMRELTPEELRAAGVSDGERTDPHYVPVVSHLDEADGFDAAFFGYGKREAEIMDPQHRVFLEAAWAALESAGYDPERYDGAIGVFGGVAANTYRSEVLATRPDLLEQAGRYPLLIGSEREYAITRVAYKLNLRGPAISVNTACSTSGVALHLACQSVLSGECDMALVGGARVRAPLDVGYLYEEDGILSPDGRCRPFDADARGTIQASGVGMLVIKRLSDALEDGDTVHALVKGTAVNNDGSAKTGFTAPGVDGQARVIAEALAMAEVDPATISYVEAHGTGTFIGDPIEIAALTKAFGACQASGGVTIGAVKSNIGHLDAGAGVAGVIKTVLALQHGEIPPTANFTTLNPQIDLTDTPFRVSGELSEWSSPTGPRRAGVSSFGLGGSNSHVVLEEASQVATTPSARNHQLLTISARSSAALDVAASQLAAHLAETTSELADVAHTLRIGRREFQHRRTVVASTAAEAAEALSSGDTRRVGTGEAREPGDAVAFMFPGGGAQHTGMGAQLYATEDVFRRAFDRCATIAARHHDLDLHGALYGPAALGEDELERPAIALPTLFAVEFALAQLWISLGLRPTALIGHSLGEYTAACLGGVFSLTDAMGLVVLRGRLFETLSEGGMLSVPLPEAEVQELLDDDLSIAAVNRDDLCVLAGASSAIERTGLLLESRQVESRPLHISVAAHSHLIDPILDEFRAYVETIALHEPSIAIVSNLTGNWVGPGEVTEPEYWARHLRETVRFVDGLETLARDKPGIYIEVGPGQTLGGYLLQHPSRTSDHEVLASLPHVADPTPDDAFFLGSVGRVWRTGVELDLSVLAEGEERRRVPLPTYPFERTRYWVERGDAPEAGNVLVADPAEVGAEANGQPEPVAEKAARRETILAELQAIFEELSGFDRDALAPHLTFLELGFDSLFMTQATAAVGRTFGVRVSFRQLFEEAPTLDALAGHLDARLADDQLPTVASGAEASTPGSRDVEAIAESNGSAPAPTGPWKPVNRADEGLTDTQSTHLADLIDRLTERSPGSKELAQAHRARLADPRTVAGFRRPWKELVYPVVGVRSAGSKIWDVDGNEYLDIAMGFGVNLFGHSPPFVVDAVSEQMRHGFEIGPQTPLAGEVAELIGQLTGNERVAFCNTGSEAVLAAMRLARTVSGRTKIVTFTNDYHGLFDEVLARGVTSGDQRRSVPIAPGIPAHIPSEMVVLDYGEPESLAYIESIASEVAAVLVEPVQSRHPDLQPVEFLRSLRALTQEHDQALIFDEMITGFRSHPGGAQELFDIRADLVTYGKVIGGGFPIGVVSGRHEYMDALDGGHWQYGDDSIPEADVTWFAGTFVRHPVALAASRASLQHLRDVGPSLQTELNGRTTALVDELSEFLAEQGAPMSIEHFSSFFLTKFHAGQEFSSLFYFYLRDHGIHVTEGRSAFLSTAHDEEDLARLSAAYKAAVRDMQDAGFLPRATVSSGSAFGLVPLTGGQQEIWLATQIGDEANCAYNLCNTIDLGGPLDVELLERSLQELIDRHSALRTSFKPDGSHQVVAPTLPVDLPVIDLSDRTESERLQALDDLRVREAGTPLDLERGPLVRTTLIRLAADQHVLFLTAHHIICDGWSSGVLIRELGELYGAGSRGEEADLAEPMQFGEYAAWQDGLRSGEEWEAAEAYWRSQAAEPYPISDIPADRVRPPVKTYDAERQTTLIDDELLSRLRTLAAGEGQTLFTVVLAAFECYLQRLSGQPEIALGVSIAGHTRFPDAALVGHCVNLAPLRRSVQADASFRAHLQTTRDAMLDAFEHQDYSYGSIVKNLSVRRDPSRTPLVSVVFNMDAALAELDFGDLVAVGGSSGRVRENFDVFVNLAGSPDGLLVEWTYNTDLFTSDSARLRLEGFVELLRAVADDVDVPVSRLGFMPRAELARIERWNSTSVAFEGPLNLIEPFEERVGACPDAVALVFGSDELTYGELNDRANRLARWLVDAGVGPEVRVGVLMERSVELVVALYAVLKAGGAYVPLDPGHPADRITYMASQAGARIVLTQERFAEIVSEEEHELLAVDAEWSVVAAHSGEDLGRPIEPDSLAYVIYTSGSTGRPKGVATPHCGIMNHLLWMRSYFDIDPSDAVLFKTPLTFDVSVWELFVPLHIGATLVIAEPGRHGDPGYLASMIVEHQVAGIHFVPSMLRMFLADRRARACTSLRWVFCSGEALTAELQRRFFDVLEGTELHNIYGPTETAMHATYWRCDPNDDSGVVPIGRPVANTQIHILDRHMQRAPIGVAGELYVGGVQLARGYIEQPEVTARQFVDDPFGGGRLYRTGDLARWRTDGQLEFLGRTDDQVKIRGNRVELGEIEAVLLQHPDVAATAVTTHALADDDVRLVAYVSPAEGSEFSESALRELAKRSLPGYMVPNLFVEHSTFAYTTSGKIDRGALPAPDVAMLPSSDERVAPRSELERQLVAIWQDQLGRDTIGVDDDFFELGGHSVLAAALMREIEEKIVEEQLPLATLFQAPTVAQLAAAIESRDWEAAWGALVPIQPNGDRPPLFFAHAHGGNVIGYHDLGRRLAPDQPFYGLQAPETGTSDRPRRIEDMAADYVEKIRAVQPEGPYLVGGWCLGGDLAFEMGRQLRALGETVALVLMIDNARPVDPAAGPTARLSRIAGRMAARIDMEWTNTIEQPMRRRPGHVAGRARRAWDLATLPLERGLAKVGPRLPRSRAYREYLIGEYHQKAYRAYDPAPYEGRVAVVRAERQPPGGRGDATLGWDRYLAGERDLVEAPGHRIGLLSEPRVEIVARLIRDAIDRALEAR